MDTKKCRGCGKIFKPMVSNQAYCRTCRKGLMNVPEHRHPHHVDIFKMNLDPELPEINCVFTTGEAGKLLHRTPKSIQHMCSGNLPSGWRNGYAPTLLQNEFRRAGDLWLINRIGINRIYNTSISNELQSKLVAHDYSALCNVLTISEVAKFLGYSHSYIANTHMKMLASKKLSETETRKSGKYWLITKYGLNLIKNYLNRKNRI